VPAQRVDAHVAACEECAQWWRQAQAQAVALRLAAVPAAPVFQVALPKPRRSWRSRLSDWARKPAEVEVRVPQGARPGRRAGHLRPAPEPPA
jgi:predicted anti-sigma-YlaC factor YlaD